MLLQELFNPNGDYPEASQEDLEAGPDVGPQLGKKGSFGRAFEDKTNQFEVIKIGHTDGAPDHDGYLAFLNTIKRLKIPYFPRVDSVEIFRNNGLTKKYHPFVFKVRMEKLIPAQDLSHSEVISLFHRYLGIDTDEVANMVQRHDAGNPGDIPPEKGGRMRPHSINTFLLRLRDLIKYPQNDNLNTAVIDKQIRVAIRAMRKVYRHFGLDLHDENIMFRRTPYGPIPVFTDPFAFRR
jgi:hypothetical protein